eukprot:10378648-Lingulodinium_polyedra.AAC.1
MQCSVCVLRAVDVRSASLVVKVRAIKWRRGFLSARSSTRRVGSTCSSSMLRSENGDEGPEDL